MSTRLALTFLLGAVLASATSDRTAAQDEPPPSTNEHGGVGAVSPQVTPEARVAPAPERHEHFHHGHHNADDSKRCRDCMPRPPRGDFMPAVFAGAGMFELTGLNKRLENAGYERIDGLTPVIGGELRVIHPSGLLTSFYGAAILPNKGNGPDSLRASWNGGFGMLDVGWAFVRLPGFTLSLSGSAGGYWATLDIYERRDAAFDAVLSNPRRSTSMGVGGVLFGAVLRADGRIPIGAPHFDRQSYLALGLRVTGLWGPALGGWDFDDYNNDVSNGPSGNLAGVYAALVIGFGGTSINPTP